MENGKVGLRSDSSEWQQKQSKQHDHYGLGLRGRAIRGGSACSGSRSAGASAAMCNLSRTHDPSTHQPWWILGFMRGLQPISSLLNENQAQLEFQYVELICYHADRVDRACDAQRLAGEHRQTV
eukprot:g58740.t1